MTDASLNKLPPAIVAIARALAERGGRALVVGGYVRDLLLGIESKDVDVEVFGLTLAELEAVLARFGDVVAVGRAFGVLRVKGLDVDFSLPRVDSKVGPGHRGFDVAVDPTLDFAAAARRRDLTINSMGLDPSSGAVEDPFGGRADLANRVLRATDPGRFGEDPLRAVRVAQFAARLEMTPDAQLRALCAGLDLGELPGERIWEELRKLLTKAAQPSPGFAFLADTGLLRFFPELQALIGVEQDPQWHPEGDVWVHTLMVVDAAARLRREDADDLALMTAALCHDLGKPSCTVREEGRVRCPGHDVAGVAPTLALLERLRVSNALVRRVTALVRHHLAPAQFARSGAGPRAYGRLARRLGAAGVSMELLARVARADHLGRTTPEALRGEFPAGDRFLAEAGRLAVADRAPRDVVLGRHLIARGLRPGREFSDILARCRDVQDSEGLREPDAILDRVLAQRE